MLVYIGPAVLLGCAAGLVFAIAQDIDDADSDLDDTKHCEEIKTDLSLPLAPPNRHIPAVIVTARVEEYLSNGAILSPTYGTFQAPPDPVKQTVYHPSLLQPPITWDQMGEEIDSFHAYLEALGSGKIVKAGVEPYMTRDEIRSFLLSQTWRCSCGCTPEE
ncbi:hypothetical protein BDV96DRAFT_652415 [Lophiotrema nucula]|uniref:Uncharacterized protein n=1 Tax=Lophiotrema nucula TaxID=690887 RepID=A0A6A5YRL8_9PLEO|nr:hypothetical protein BDV96DRAFT_652415 [Lophiotrema nucula]